MTATFHEVSFGLLFKNKLRKAPQDKGTKMELSESGEKFSAWPVMSLNGEVLRVLSQSSFFRQAAHPI